MGLEQVFAALHRLDRRPALGIPHRRRLPELELAPNWHFLQVSHCLLRTVGFCLAFDLHMLLKIEARLIVPLGRAV